MSITIPSGILNLFEETRSCHSYNTRALALAIGIDRFPVIKFYPMIAMGFATRARTLHYKNSLPREPTLFFVNCKWKLNKR